MKFHNKIYFSDKQYDLLITKEIKLLLKKAIDKTLTEERFASPAEVSVTFTDDVKIRTLNKKYRGKDASTDVLSFPILSEDDSVGDIEHSGRYAVLGDIVISVEHALDQAVKYGHSAERELAFLTVHSMLHLLGYDHERSAEEDELMQSKQEQILCSIGLARGDGK